MKPFYYCSAHNSYSLNTQGKCEFAEECAEIDDVRKCNTKAAFYASDIENLIKGRIEKWKEEHMELQKELLKPDLPVVGDFRYMQSVLIDRMAELQSLLAALEGGEHEKA